MDTAGGETQNINPVLQPYLETLTMFWDFEEKKEKKNIMLVCTVSTYMAQDLQATYIVLE